MKKTTDKTTVHETSFTIRGELARILNGMEGTNWTTSISKNNVKTVSVTFRVKQPTVEMRVA